MAGLQRFWCWQDAELEKLTFIGLYTAETVGPGWITPYSPSPLPSSLWSTFQLKLFLPFPSSSAFLFLPVSCFVSVENKSAKKSIFTCTYTEKQPN